MDAVLEGPEGSYLLSLDGNQSPMAAKLIKAYQEKGYVPKN
jgi:hypothetical protein